MWRPPAAPGAGWQRRIEMVQEVVTDATSCEALDLDSLAEAYRLLVEEGAQVNVSNANGTTALHFAAVSGHAEVAAALLALRAPVGARSEDGRSNSTELLLLFSLSSSLSLLLILCVCACVCQFPF